MTTIDLFAGCGGLSLGFKKAGFTSLFASDIDENCMLTFQKNFPEVPFLCADITTITESDIRQIVGEHEVDVILGGPPCQGFSLANKHRDSNNTDPRNKLFYHYLKVLSWFMPKAFVLENVRGLLSMQKGLVIKEIKRCFSEVGYNVDYRVLRASMFGVPQMRDRVIVIGIRNDLQQMPKFPRPNLNCEISVDDAISDLPIIEAGQGEDNVAYGTAPQNDYQRLMRKDSSTVFNHIAMKHTKRLVERFKAIKPGQGLLDVWETHGAVKRGNPQEKSTIKFSQNNNRVFGNKPAPTIAASFQSNFIHPHLDRNFTAREGARLQSFPDDFIFCGFRTKMSWEKGLSQYQQIGNAVPPLLAYAIANTLKEQLTPHCNHD